MARALIAYSDFYVYVLFLSDGITPFYVGKGRNGRWLMHEVTGRSRRSTNNLQRDVIIWDILDRGESLQKVKIAENLTDFEALRLEIDLIRLIGRSPNGPLVNATNGGEGTAGRKNAEKTRQRMSDAAKKRGISADHMAKMLASPTRGRWGPHSAETIAKMKAAKIGIPRSADTIEKMRIAATKQAARPGAKEAFVERTSRPEVRQRSLDSRKKSYAQPEVIEAMSSRTKQYFASPEARRKASEAAKARFARPGEREAARARKLGKKPSEETKAKMRASHKQRNEIAGFVETPT